MPLLLNLAAYNDQGVLLSLCQAEYDPEVDLLCSPTLPEDTDCVRAYLWERDSMVPIGEPDTIYVERENKIETLKGVCSYEK